MLCSPFHVIFLYSLPPEMFFLLLQFLLVFPSKDDGLLYIPVRPNRFNSFQQLFLHLAVLCFFLHFFGLSGLLFLCCLGEELGKRQHLEPEAHRFNTRVAQCTFPRWSLCLLFTWPRGFGKEIQGRRVGYKNACLQQDFQLRLLSTFVCTELTPIICL